MNTDSTIRNLHQTIIAAATAKLNRQLSVQERRFITSRRGFIALEMILDTISSESGRDVERYLNSELGS